MEIPAHSAIALPDHHNNLKILSLDGGGVRGWSILFILQHLMNHIRTKKKLQTTPLPCDVFDLIIGTSTGGIIALMLGRLRMSVDDAITAYEDLSKAVFGKAHQNKWNRFSGKPQYSSKVLEDAITKIAKDLPLADPDRAACKVAVVAVKERAASDIPDLLRTYESSVGYLNCTVSDAARATTAMMDFFEPAIVQIKHGLKVTYVDGSLGNNNPTYLCVQEAERIWGRNCKFKSIVSIGTGTSSNVKFKGNKFALASKLKEIQASCRKVHLDMENRFGGRRGVYCRFDVPTDLEKIGLDEWESLQEIGELTHAYLQSESVKIRECVETLIQHMAKDTKSVPESASAAPLDNAYQTMRPSTARRASKDEGIPVKIREWLAAPDPSTSHNAACEKRQSGTGEWFLQGIPFTLWKEFSSSLIWIHSIPGGGKTVLCSTIIEHLQDTCKEIPSMVIAYFYFDFNDTRKQNFRGFLHSLITQLSFQCSELAPVLSVLGDFHNKNHDGGRQPSIKDLIMTLERMIKQMIEDSRRVYIVIDALDECGRTDQADLLNFIKTIITRSKTQSVHLLVTSRYSLDVEESLTPLVDCEIDLSHAGINSDIEAYVRHTLCNDRNFRKFEAENAMVEEVLMTRAAGMFKWVECQLIELRKCLTRSALNHALQNLPKTLDETYIRILEGIPEEYSEFASKILRFLAFSEYPLTVRELAEVIVVDTDSDGSPRLAGENRLRNPFDVLAICSSLVTVRSEPVAGWSDDTSALSSPQSYGRLDDVARLSHLSVKDYLTSGRIQAPDLRIYSFSASLAHQFIAQTCITYLLCLEMDELDDSIVEELPLARYASQYWMSHFTYEDSVMKMLQPLVKELLQPCKQFYNWVRLCDFDGDSQSWLTRDSDDIASPLYYASLSGLSEQCKWLLENGADVNSPGASYETALMAAYENGYLEVVRLLIEHGANVNVWTLFSPPSPYDTVLDGSILHLASQRGEEEIVRLVLENGAEVNAGDLVTALHVASAVGHDTIVRLLLEYDADINVQGEYATPLVVATEHGHTTTVQLLVEEGADVNARGGLHGSALLAASYLGHSELWHLLVKNGAEVDVHGGRYGTGLRAWCEHGDESIVRVLIEKGAEVNAPVHGSSALIAASRRGHKEIVQFLLDNCADVNARNYRYGNALLAASEQNHEDVVGLLLERGAELNVPGVHFGSALLAASELGHAKIVQLLLEKGADVHVRGRHNNDALLMSSERGHTAVVELLLESGADVNSQGMECGSALQAACYFGHEEVARLLLESGADVHARGGVYGSGLHAASRRGYTVLVQLLLDNGADVNAHGGRYGTALLVASIYGHEDVVQILLDNGADVNAQNEYYGTPLQAACERDHEAVMKLLS